MSDIHNNPTVKQVKDPVCGMVIGASEAAAKVEHGNHTHYFCSQKCKEAFEKDPARYH